MTEAPAAAVTPDPAADLRCATPPTHSRSSGDGMSPKRPDPL
jgi:hypothetical protein